MKTRLLLTAAALAAAAIPTASAQAIVGGRTAAAGDFPFIAQITTVDGSTVGTCTGSLLTPNYVLTAAHCVDEKESADVHVRVGNVVKNTGGVPRRVSRIIRNPKYYGNINGWGTDVALLRLSHPITSIAPLPLAPANMTGLWDGATAWANYDDGFSVGWGRINADTPTNTLQWAPAKIGKPFVDMDTNPRINVIPVTSPTCLGDSGGPLLVRVNGAYASAGVHTNGTCGVSGYSTEVAAGPNRTFVDSNVARMPYSFFGVGDWDGDGHQDQLIRHDVNGTLLLVRGKSVRGYSPYAPTTIGTGYQGYTSFGVADWDGDLKQDLIVRQDTTGDLILQRGTGAAGGYSYGGSFKIGAGFNNMTPFGAGDWNRDGKADLLVRDDSTGTLRMHYGFGNSTTVITNTWSVVATNFNRYQPFGVADITRDGNVDLLTRDNSHGGGPLKLFPGQGRTSVSAGTPTTYSAGDWHPQTSFGLTDWDGDGIPNILSRKDATGELFLTTSSNSVLIGTGY